MKILAAGDIHGDSNLAETLAERAEKEKVDLVVLCGDLTQSDQNSENIIGHFLKRNKKVIFVPGNHDSKATSDFLSELYKVKNIHGYSVKYNDVGFFGCSGVNLGLDQLSEDEIFKLLKKGHEKIDYLSKKIMVTHVHPRYSMMEQFSSFFKGSEGIRKAIETFNPDVLFCSHVHEAEGIEEKIGNTSVFNVGKKGKILEI